MHLINLILKKPNILSWIFFVVWLVIEWYTYYTDCVYIVRPNIHNQEHLNPNHMHVLHTDS